MEKKKPMKQEQINFFKELFDNYTKSSTSNKITVRSLYRIISSLMPVTELEIEEMISPKYKLFNPTQTITFETFMDIISGIFVDDSDSSTSSPSDNTNSTTSKKKEGDDVKKLLKEAVFETINSSKTGYISFPEVQHILNDVLGEHKLKTHDVMDLVRFVGKEKDGFVSKKEFMDFIDKEQLI